MYFNEFSFSYWHLVQEGNNPIFLVHHHYIKKDFMNIGEINKLKHIISVGEDSIVLASMFQLFHVIILIAPIFVLSLL